MGKETVLKTYYLYTLIVHDKTSEFDTQYPQVSRNLHSINALIYLIQKLTLSLFSFYLGYFQYYTNIICLIIRINKCLIVFLGNRYGVQAPNVTGPVCRCLIFSVENVVYNIDKGDKVIILITLLPLF